MKTENLAQSQRELMIIEIKPTTKKNAKRRIYIKYGSEWICREKDQAVSDGCGRIYWLLRVYVGELCVMLMPG